MFPAVPSAPGTRKTPQKMSVDPSGRTNCIPNNIRLEHQSSRLGPLAKGTERPEKLSVPLGTQDGRAGERRPAPDQPGAARGSVAARAPTRRAEGPRRLGGYQKAAAGGGGVLAPGQRRLEPPLGGRALYLG